MELIKENLIRELLNVLDEKQKQIVLEKFYNSCIGKDEEEDFKWCLVDMGIL